MTDAPGYCTAFPWGASTEDAGEREGKMLGAREVGAFLLRFSERFPGKLVISFNDHVRDGRPHQHVLVDISSATSPEQQPRPLTFRIKFDDGREHDYQSLSELILNCRRLTKLVSGGTEHRKEEAFRRSHLAAPFYGSPGSLGYPEPLTQAQSLDQNGRHRKP